MRNGERPSPEVVPPAAEAATTTPVAATSAATTAGKRLVSVPSRIRELGILLGASVVVPLWIGGPVLLIVLALAALTTSGVIWAAFWIGLGLIVVTVLGLAVGLLLQLTTTMVRWIEFRPQGNAVEREVMGFVRASTVAATDLQRVVGAGSRRSASRELRRERVIRLELQPSAEPAPLRTYAVNARQLG
jgi:hypothetical protein